ncbi:hypothetical protein DRE_04398 [Drechslerella stenobrocha 248]|uniref:Carboxylic ester hydrolase n=1 Tax=Drechslerella stenobrocha 248 TaxID=1043628 RepID=W7IBJ9_9PEZI|nr:hypothetical protein DRE_04398 [Drechslerella stenobrocha 248]
MKYFLTLVLGALSPAVSSASTNGNIHSFQHQCTALSRTLRAPNTEVILSEFVASGVKLTFPESANNTCPKSVISLADICRLRLNTTTSSTSSVITEVFMPVDWESKGKRRFLMGGNGGNGGCIPYGDLAFGNRLGFAAVGHDNGHAGDTSVPFRNNPQVLEDHIYRALFVAGRVAKVAVRTFYNRPISKSYYWGCSAGGRQGMKAAQDFPDEYDGILAVAPALYEQALNGQASTYFKLTGPPGSPTFLSVDQWKRVHRMVIDQCDWIDGVLDGVLEDPMKCQPRPEALLCGAGQTWDSHRCLTAKQVNTVREFYSPLYGTNGQFIAPRMNPLTREFLGFRVNYGGSPGPLAEGWYQDVLFNDPSWTIANNFSLATIDYDMQVDKYGVGTNKTDLSALRDSGGKLLLYHGLVDGLITSELSYHYYGNVVRDMGARPEELDQFFRFFPISGLDHCFTGEGPWFVGGPVQTDVRGALNIDPEQGALMKLVRWVENGTAPETLMGYKLINGTVHGKREHCKYPKKTVYRGVGDPDLPSSWKCSDAFV